MQVICIHNLMQVIYIRNLMQVICIHYLMQLISPSAYRLKFHTFSYKYRNFGTIPPLFQVF